MDAFKVLKTDSDFLAAALTQSRVAIFELRGDLAGCIVDYGGHVVKWSPISVKVSDAYYIRGEFEFRMVLA
ncbi:hypothetical protein [Paenibacillus sp. PK3_47]|uniref:hypothetical protein n=1 Tax=Paenibacillus sp. PK3_47 TaxID=2072642 RepID=UPI00201DEE1E|nr:hypothetical protein [Paenibacillus sp. PK3_47]